MYNEPIALATMGQGFPIFRYPAYVAQTILPSEAPPYSRQEVLILHNKYPGPAWVNQALVDEGDNGLRVEVHRYWSLMDEADRKERKLSAIQDRLMDISMDLHANMLCLAGAEAIKQLEAGGPGQGLASLSTCGNSNKGVLFEGGGSVKAPPMVGPTWTRVRFTLGSDCSLSLFQGTTLLCFLLHAFLIDRLHTSNVR